jgi:hypothetical protein
MSLKTMTVSKLKDLKLEVEAAIRAKVLKRRHEIETELLKLSQFEAAKPTKVVRTWARETVAAKVAKMPHESFGADKPKTSTPKQAKQPKRSRKASKFRKAEDSTDTILSFPATVNKIKTLPIEPPSAVSIDANVASVDVSAAA